MKQTMIQHYRFALVVSIACLLASCATTKNEEDAQAQTSQQKPALPLPIAPNTCRLIATIEQIDPIIKGTSEKDPCSKAPCVATVRVDSVLGYGSAFPSTMPAGKKVRVKFALTLHSTKDLLPEVTPALPGLNVGSKFEALVNGDVPMGKTEPLFTVYSYKAK